jgi:ribonuclease VapC
VRHISAASVVQAGIVVYARHGDYGERELDLLLHRLSVEIASVTAEHADLARAAFRQFGKGRHPAGLNYGDCFSYALATLMDEPLLFTGDDFAKTDVRSA